MRINYFKSMVFVIILVASFFAFLFIAYSDTRPVNHVHIRGKVMTVDGAAVDGAQLGPPAHPREECKILTGIPDGHQGCHIMSGVAGQTIPKTTSNGEYHIVVELPNLEYIQNVGVDKSRMNWQKPDYLVVPK